ncbi:MAG TPA: hypothetical protein H9713_08620 [Candidatus Mediterraneibacter surreyensis]|nr:hypothetical protein [Candidatus Mediterraneibacter surreyensis]
MISEENKTPEEMNIPDANPAEPAVQPEETGAAMEAEAETKAMTEEMDRDARDAGMTSEFSREEWILTHIGDENLMEYLRMEQKKEEDVRKAKEARQKRILSAFQLTISLAAVIVVMFLLRENPTVMVNILYIIAIIAALWIWKNPRS